MAKSMAKSMVFLKTVHNQVLSPTGRDNFDKIDWADVDKKAKDSSTDSKPPTPQ